MANENQVHILQRGFRIWNKWRAENIHEEIDLQGVILNKAKLSRVYLIGANLSNASLVGADLSGADLSDADLHEIDLSHANLLIADLSGADLRGAILKGANLREVNFSGADLSGADLTGANLTGVNLRETNLSGANLKGADLSYSSLIQSVLESTNLSDCRIYGSAVWDVMIGNDVISENLIITQQHEPKITVDNLEVAQFIYLILNNNKLRNVIDTVTSKVVLILGRFKKERKEVLDAIREKLRSKNYLPVMFDFDESQNRDVKETVLLLANLAKFIVADLSDPSSIPLELGTVIPSLPSVPVVSIIDKRYLYKNNKVFSMFNDLMHYDWVTQIQVYENCDELLSNIDIKIITPAEKKLSEIKNKEYQRKSKGIFSY